MMDRLAIELTDSDLVTIKRLCLPNKVIGWHLGITTAAVSMRISRIGEKLGVENRTAIVVRTLELGLVTIDQFIYNTESKPYIM